MELRLDRLIRLPSYSLGVLSLRREGEDEFRHQCYTKEPGVRGGLLSESPLFIAGESALPAGLYTVSRQSCRRFGLVVPLLVSAQLIAHGGLRISVGMRILPGHHMADSDSGILVGLKQGPKDLSHTKAAYEALDKEIEMAIVDGEAVECLIT